ncbi:hypothetical protein [Spirosoma sp. KUDC1026]|uniref:hypothetical protein n=1 Tax=Spirosoma sp. KUDC1026 TaxID=2745947 RepID=UPI00159B99DF|nr:hypothetical protein [Spirosoma sp. KUDC1026]QKZ15904.1 hypothetical protein HU175_24615 [Spirosoma sp. KUDC1026]
MFISRKKYNDLIKLCSREQARAQEAEHQARQLVADNQTLGRLVMHYKKRGDRLEYALHHPRNRGRFVKQIPITQEGQS